MLKVWKTIIGKLSGEKKVKSENRRNPDGDCYEAIGSMMIMAMRRCASSALEI